MTTTKKDRWIYRGTVKTRCATCGGTCYWHDEAWVCERCGDEWYPDHNPSVYAPPEQAASNCRCCGNPTPGRHTPPCSGQRCECCHGDCHPNDCPGCPLDAALTYAR